MSNILKKKSFLFIIFLCNNIVIAAQFYPGFDRDICTDFQELDRASCCTYPVAIPQDQIKLLIVPYSYDAQSQYLVAATYRMLVQHPIDKIIFVGIAWMNDFHGVAISCDKLACTVNFYDLASLLQSSLFHLYQVPFCYNMDVQSHLGLLQFYLPDCPIVPCMLGDVSCADIVDIAQKLIESSTDRTLIILSCDFMEYKNCIQDCPCDQSKVCKIYDQDAKLVQSIQSHEYGRYYTAPCSLDTLLPYFFCSPGFDCIEPSCFVGYATSCLYFDGIEDVTSYGSFIFQPLKMQQFWHHRLSYYEQRQLLHSARKGLMDLFDMNLYRQPCMISYYMQQPSGIFVSLYNMTNHGSLLFGSMGVIETDRSSYSMAYQMAQQAASVKTRLHPFLQKDLNNTIISISMVCDMCDDVDCQDIKINDGVVLRYQQKKAIYLPSLYSYNTMDYYAVLNHLSQEIAGIDDLWIDSCACISRFVPHCFQED